MLFPKLAILASAASLATFAVAEETYDEVVDGYRFIKSGPKELKPKDNYELEFARFTLNLLKTRIGADGLIELLQPDIKEADAFWHDVVDRSTDKWVPTDGRAVAFLPNLTAYSFAAWSQSPFADRSNNAANPEHYVKRTTNLNGTLQSEILEGWGGVTTHFSISDYSSPPNRAKHPMLRELPEFPFQAAGDKVLRDGTKTRFGVLHISARDVPGEEYGSDIPGVDIYATVWYGDGVEDEHIEVERQHITVEIINQSIQAQKDIASGEFKPPALPSASSSKRWLA
ncbi:unnamed protein product [Clonostachys chloroleuca]|uniref:Uncharacterized protein n=1 Tax=Clonostachys chloroleuca TaxID=1926264 RepID=A0AA35LYI2_9HYPO|nr:unnamed protein product [Clonostachys chloroleuca]